MSLCESLIKWLQTVEGKKFSKDQLLDGILIGASLQAISPNFFNDQWISRLKTDVGDNWRLKVMNLKKLVSGIEDYYSEVLCQRLHEDILPDVNKIGEHGDSEQLARLLSLVLGCAVNCDEKQEYVRRIMALEQGVQQDVMNAIQELMKLEAIVTSEASSPRPHEDGPSQQVNGRLQEQVFALTEEKEQLRQRCHELDMQVTSLLEEKEVLAAENERLAERMTQAENLDESHSAVGQRFQQLKTRVDQLQAEISTMEIERDDLKIRYDLQARDLNQQQQKVQELTRLAGQASAYKDEVDVLRHSVDKLEKYEAAIESYKRKIEDMADLRNEARLLEERNSEYLKKNLELEEEVKKSQTMRSQLDMYRVRSVELERKVSELTKRAEEAEFGAKRAQDKLDSLQQEHLRLVAERQSMNESQDEMIPTVHDAVQGSGLSAYGGPSTPSLELVSLPFAVREKLKRLEHENEMLRQRAEGSDSERVQLMEEQLAMADAKRTELDAELRTTREQVLTLRAEMAETAGSRHHTAAEAVSALKTRLQERSARCDELDGELRAAVRRAEAAETQSRETAGRVKMLEEAARLKDVQMDEMEERYKKYLTQAKSVIQGLGRSSSGGAELPEVQMLQAQLDEKSRIIDLMEKDNERTKVVREQEERLMVSAWYNMTSQLHRRAMEERLSAGGGAASQSFLARQRQIHIHQSMSTTGSAPPR